MLRSAAKSKILIAVALLCVASTPVFAQDNLGLPDINSGTPLNDLRFPEGKWGKDFLAQLYAGPNYLSKDEVVEIDPAPANDSDVSKQELVTLLQYMVEKRDESTVAAIKYENQNMPIVEAFAHSGLFVDTKENRGTKDLMLITGKEVGFFILREKMRYARARPTQLSPELSLVIDLPPHPAYPSGHAGQSYAVALILSALDPENESKYKQFAENIGQRREIAGVHYPSDSDAGRKIADQIISKLMTVKEFQDKFNQAKSTFIKPTPKSE